MPKIEESILVESDNIVEVIVKYSGDLTEVKKAGYEVEILSCNYAIITSDITLIDDLLKFNQIQYIEKSKELSVELKKSKNSICYNQIEQDLNTKLTGKGVIIGIIDSGIDYTHMDFRNTDGTTRIKSIWDLSIDGNPPVGTTRGTVYTEDDINKALNGEISIAHIDFIGHGTAVSGICVSNGNSVDGEFTGIAPQADIVVVKVNERVFSSFAKNTDIMRAIKYIIEVGIIRKQPVVINISFGTNDGSHDGSSLFEVYIDEMCDTHKNNIVIATGNEGATGHHYYEKISQGDISRVEFQSSQALKEFTMSIWNSFVDELELELIASNGDRTGILVEKVGVYNFTLGNYKVTILFGTPTPYTINQEIFLSFKAVGDIRQNEIWFLDIHAKTIVVGDVNIWLPVIEQTGSETFFFKATEETTLTIPATSRKCISVGGYNENTNTFAFFSGRGFDRKGMIKPDLVAPSVNITSAKKGGGYSNFTGTSFAAPFVTGSIALMMEWGIINGNDPFLYGQRSKALLHRGAKREKDMQYPNEQYGYGKLCITDSILYLDEKDRMYENRSEEVEKVEGAEEYLNIVVGSIGNLDSFIKEKDFIEFVRFLNGSYALVKVPFSKFDEFERSVGLLFTYHVPSICTLSEYSSLEASGIAEVQSQKFLQLDGRGTLIAIIDTGIDYNNKVFKYEDNTSKIEYLWDMTIDGNPPDGFDFGTEYNNEDINKALNSENGNEIVPSVDEDGHGTFLASICAGREDEEGNIGISPESRLLVVKLRQSSDVENKLNYVPLDNETLKYSSIDIMLAVEYVEAKRLELIKPISILISQGTNLGPHDGKSIFEKYMENIALKIGAFIGVATGNEADKRHHVKKNLPLNDSYVDIELIVGENEKSFLLEIWSYGFDQISTSIITPLGEDTGIMPFKNNTLYENKFVLEDATVDVQYSINLTNGNQKTRIGFTNPTSGIWIIRVYGDEVVNGVLHGWLPRSGLIGEKTYFPLAEPDYTIVIPSTAKSVVATGGYNHYENSLFAQSGRGPSRDYLLKPTLVAPSVDVMGHYPNEMGTMTGTSVGNAHVVGSASLIMQWAIKNKSTKKINTLTIGNILVGGCIQFKQLPNQNVLTGFGKMNLINSFKNINL